MDSSSALRVVMPFVVVVLAACQQGVQQSSVAEESVFPELRGPFLGQTPPGQEPEVFAPGIVSTGLHTRDVAMTPDGSELYFCATVGARTVILVTRQIEGVWTEPEVAPFSGRYNDIEPAIAPDGERFFFLSSRPPNGQPEQPGWGYQDIWVMDRSAEGWSEPYNLGPPINTDAPEYYPSVTVDGTLYFTREDDQRVSAIYRSRLVDGAYAEPERLGDRVNCGQSQFNAYIAPDESWIIVPVVGREDSLGGVDYYIVFRDPDDSWSEPVNMGDRINRPDGREWSASLSADGAYLFFMTSRPSAAAQASLTGNTVAELLELGAQPGNGSSDIYWVDAGIIDTLRPVS